MHITEAIYQRDSLLARSDWTQLSDCPLTVEQKQAWAEYRQFIRNVSEQKDFPSIIDWGTPPV